MDVFGKKNIIVFVQFSPSKNSKIYTSILVSGKKVLLFSKTHLSNILAWTIGLRCSVFLAVSLFLLLQEYNQLYKFKLIRLLKIILNVFTSVVFFQLIGYSLVIICEKWTFAPKLLSR